MNATYLAKNQVCHIRMKHINVRFYFVREILDEGDIKLQKIHMKKTPVDILAKVVPGMEFAHCKELFYILPVA